MQFSKERVLIKLKHYIILPNSVKLWFRFVHAKYDAEYLPMKIIHIGVYGYISMRSSDIYLSDII